MVVAVVDDPNGFVPNMKVGVMVDIVLNTGIVELGVGVEVVVMVLC